MKRPIVKNGTTVNSCSQPPEAAAEWFTEIKCHVFGEGTSPVLCMHVWIRPRRSLTRSDMQTRRSRNSHPPDGVIGHGLRAHEYSGDR